MNQIWGRGNPDAGISPSWTQMQPLASKPETMQTFEWQNIFYALKTRFAVNMYYEMLDDFITWFFPVTNCGKFRGYGAELEVLSKPTSMVSIWANMATNHTVFTPVDSASLVTEGGRYIPAWGVNPENEIVGVPKFTAACGTDWEIVDHLFFNPSFRMMYGQTLFKNGNFQYDLANAKTYQDTLAINDNKNSYWTHVNDYFIDFGISYKDAGFKGLDIGLAVKNVTNNQSEQSQSFNVGTNVPRGRTWDLTARYSF
jgi:hypothetical protein